jgi:glycosyltransferase involved in cell wall biosynthesis
VLVKAFRRLSCTADDAKLIIYGDPAKAWPPFLRELKSAIGDDRRIVLGGSFPNQEAQRYYAGLDALVIPSIWYENSPNVILEAFASGTPVMASNLGGMAELVQHGVNGCLFEPNDVESLQSALQTIIADPQPLIDWRRQIPRVKTVDEEMRELETVYAIVLNKRRGSQ